MSELCLIVGCGKTGASIARYLQRRQKAFVVYDTRANPDHLMAFKQYFPANEIYLETIPDHLYAQLYEIICSPGVPLDNPVLKKASELSIPIIGDVECFAREVNAPVVAITGTNGKSTVTTLVGEMIKASGKQVAVAGNIGAPVLDCLDDGVKYDAWVLELSSFQLDLIYSLQPVAATILNITPDHLDRHHAISNYILSKQRIYQRAKTMIYNRADNNTVPHTEQHSAVMQTFGLDHPPTSQDWGIDTMQNQVCLTQGSYPLLSVDELPMKGRHNWENALAACALAKVLDIELKYMQQVLRSFPGLPHRTQWVRQLEQVTWINDSKGTNVGAAISAINGIGSAISGKIILIAGGQGKGADFSPLCTAVSQHVRQVVLIGEDANQIEAALKQVVPISRAMTMEEAVVTAKANACPGDVVLLSPACASFDMFRDFNHRGEVFTAVVSAL